MALEVIWPQHRWHYLTVDDPDIPPNPPPLVSTWVEPDRSRAASISTPCVPSRRRRSRSNGAGKRSHASVDVTAQQGRALAVHALIRGAKCRDQRAGALLGVCRRTVGRDRDQPPVTTPAILERAQALLAASANRGSTPEERAAAAAWLTAGATSIESQVGHLFDVNERQASPTLPAWTRDQVDACGRLHRRIRVRADAIRRLLEPEAARDELIEIILDLLGEIRRATEALEALLVLPRTEA